MPTWLPGVLTALILGLAGNWISILVAVRLNAQAMEEHSRRLLAVEEKKLDLSLHVAHKDDIMNRIGTVAEGLKSAGHRMNNFDQRISAVDDRAKGAA